MIKKLSLALIATFGLVFFPGLGIVPTAEAAPQTIKTASLKGKSGHKASGMIRIVKDGDVTKIIFADDFKLEDAPDPKLAWGNNGYKRGTIFAKLNKLTGAQEYVIPAGTDLSRFNQFWLWCEKFNVALAVGRLQ